MPCDKVRWMESPAAIRPEEPRIAPAAIQMPTWVRPTEPTPMILPAISSSGRMVASRTSKMREVFSSMMERATFIP